MGEKILEVIPYKNFKEKINLIKKYEKSNYIEVENNYIIVY